MGFKTRALFALSPERCRMEFAPAAVLEAHMGLSRLEEAHAASPIGAHSEASGHVSAPQRCDVPPMEDSAL